MKYGIRVLGDKRVFSSVTWGLVALSVLLMFLHTGSDSLRDDQLLNTSFGLMLLTGFLTQCVPPGTRRNIAPFVASAVCVVVHTLLAR